MPEAVVSTTDLANVVEVQTTQSTDDANEMLDKGWKLLTIAGRVEWPAYVLGRLA